jgi:hypothetical protein
VLFCRVKEQGTSQVNQDKEISKVKVKKKKRKREGIKKKSYEGKDFRFLCRYVG